MELVRSFLCPDCNDIYKITDGDYLFSYNLECKQGHKKINLDQDYLLKKRKIKQNIFKCKNHRKRNHIHCFECNEDICILCHKDSHQNHKFEYLKNLNLTTREQYNTKYNMQKQKEILQIFLTELNIFQQKLNLHIETLKEKLKTQYEFRTELFQNISEKNNFSYTDIENFNIYSKNEKYKKIDGLLEGFINKPKFLEKYDYLKNILTELIKRGKYIEERNIVNRINNYIDLNLMPLNQDKLFVQCIRNYITKNSEITIYQEIQEKQGDKYDYKPIINKTFPFIINKCPILIENSPKIFGEISFYCTSDNSVIKIKLKNICQNDLIPKYDCIINMFQIFHIRALAILSPDKNIIFDSLQNITLYDSNFKTKKDLNIILPSTNGYVDNVLTIDKNTLIFTMKTYNQTVPYIYTLIIDENNNNNNSEIGIININGLTPMPLFYLKSKKYLIAFCSEYKYNNIKENNYFYISIINFDVSKPEIIQMININYYDISKKVFYFNCFDDDSFYFPICQQTYNKEMFYKVIYISQYKLIKGDFIEISRLKKEDDFSLKRFNSYGS